jgi:hypothetical protein
MQPRYRTRKIWGARDLSAPPVDGQSSLHGCHFQLHPVCSAWSFHNSSQSGASITEYNAHSDLCSWKFQCSNATCLTRHSLALHKMRCEQVESGKCCRVIAEMRFVER